MQKKFQQVEIGLASPKQIKQWAERELPTGEIVGEVTSWETVNYKTLKPEPNGLFCQKIFGPVVDYMCACGKKSNKIYMGFCLKCGVELTTSRVRRYRLGYIKLKQPIVHTLYATHKPSPLGLCLDWSNKRIQAIMYGTEFCKLSPYFNVFLGNILIQRVLFKKATRIQKNKLSFEKNLCFLVKTKSILPFLVPLPKETPGGFPFYFLFYNKLEFLGNEVIALRRRFSFSKKLKLFGTKRQLVPKWQSFLGPSYNWLLFQKALAFWKRNQTEPSSALFQKAKASSFPFQKAKLIPFQKTNVFIPFLSKKQSFLERNKNVSFLEKKRKGKKMEWKWNKQSYSIRQKFIFSQNNKKISKKPKLFGDLKNTVVITKKLETDLLLYAITYNATWQQVENIQDFLFYISEQGKAYEKVNPYYSFQKGIKSNTTKHIPQHEQCYPIQTGGIVFEKILFNFKILPLYQELILHHYLAKRYIIYLQAKLKWYPIDGEWDDERNRVLKKITRIKEYQQKQVKRLQYFRDFFNTGMNPAWMILRYLPVLPPGLRPIMSIQGELLVSDINSLYRKVLTRNKRVNCVTNFKIFDTALSGSWASWCYNLRQVQEAVDSLFKTGSIDSGKTTKSLLDSLKGKKGRFRQHLLGKRVDYSGRSVIVVGPKLKIYECGLPKQMAIQLFQPFLIQKLRNKRIALTTTAAKNIITQKKPIIWSLLREILQKHPVLLNRAPTLHRLGIQAFLPRLVEGKAILLHPLVCSAFNADFDGDQMAVHIPLGSAPRSEAFLLMWSRNHILAPASGQPLLLPSQDMVLGCYYLTIFKNSKLKTYKTNTTKTGDVFCSGFYFSTLNQVQQAYNQGIIKTHTPIWVRWFGIIQNFSGEHDSKSTEQPIEFRLDLFGKSDYIFHDRELQKPKQFSNSFSIFNTSRNSMYIRTTPGRVFFHNKIPLGNSL
uniref:DNA-directed RNA polymerase subunit n=1 Tax=Dicloster acuatus TaxID=91190 RepID=A0A097KQI0_9CHLO|nr:beta' subunit of RNA polymerase [Dicloster acuatus]AIT95443.1 beta' subunit of RNA polymerase [Dicloster acuatus]